MFDKNPFFIFIMVCMSIEYATNADLLLRPINDPAQEILMVGVDCLFSLVALIIATIVFINWYKDKQKGSDSDEQKSK